MARNIESYYQTFDPAKLFERIFYRDGYVLQGRELNDAQEMAAHRLKQIADAILADGDIIRDAQITVNEKTGEVQAQSGAVYLNGAVRGVAPATFTIPTTGTIAVGIRMRETVVSEMDDPSLRNPAQGVDGEGEPGAWRLKVETFWSYDGDGTTGDFFPVHVVDNGVVRAKEQPPALDSFNALLARYDRDSTGGGSYVVEGLAVRRANDDADGNQVYTVAEGRARVNGYGVTLPTARRLLYAAAPDLRFVDTEIHKATADASTEAGQRILVAHPPLKNVTELRITAQKTVTLTHGSYSGAADSLPDTAVVDILEVRQGDTVFEADTDYVRTGDAVDWSPAGNEPATGSSYAVTYTHMAAAAPEEQDEDGFTVRGAVPGTSIILKYNQMLPRIDRLCLTGEGLFEWIRGVAAERNARPPAVPDALLPLARIRQTWRRADAADCVTVDAVRVVPFGEIAGIHESIDQLWREVARNRLEMDAGTREAGARVGVQVDPLLDDSMRDMGAENTAAVFDGILTLPVAATVHNLTADVTAPSSTQYAPRVLLEQPYRTGSMRVNPYDAFERMPAEADISPSVDHWVERQVNVVGATTRYLETGHYVPGNSMLVSQSSATSLNVLSSAASELAYLREIDVAFTLRGFFPGEELESVTFDGITVETSEA